MDENDNKVTVLLRAVARGDKAAEQELVPMIYEHLHQTARRLMELERSDHTLQPTALVSELYLKLFREASADWENRAHFFAIAAQNMRHILVDHARSRTAQKRPSPKDRIYLQDIFVYSNQRSAEILALDEALEKLGEFEPHLSKLVEMRFFDELSNKEIAHLLNVSESTVKRDWVFARSWIFEFLEGGRALSAGSSA